MRTPGPAGPPIGVPGVVGAGPPPRGRAGRAKVGGPGGGGSGVGTGSRYGTLKHFALVGHTNLGKRGTNSPIAVAGPCVYVGDRYDQHGIAIVDVRNPAKPKQVGTIAPQ